MHDLAVLVLDFQALAEVDLPCQRILRDHPANLPERDEWNVFGVVDGTALGIEEPLSVVSKMEVVLGHEIPLPRDERLEDSQTNLC